MFRIAKKTRLRYTLIVFLVIVAIIVIFYSALYTPHESRFPHFLTSNNDNNNVNVHNDNETVFDNVIPLINANSDASARDEHRKTPLLKDTKRVNKISLIKFPWSEVSNDDNERQKCDAIDAVNDIDIITGDVYRKLEFRPNFKSYWNYTFEQNYFKVKENWRQTPLKVWQEVFLRVLRFLCVNFLVIIVWLWTRMCF